MNQLDALKLYTTVVADTGDFKQIGQFQPQDATTNPSLILKAVLMAEHQQLLQKTMKQHHGVPMDQMMDHLLVRFGCNILAQIPGRVSTEVDARLSFDKEATMARARQIVAFYKSQGVDTDKRVLIKIAATWEGIQAAKVLEQEGIHTNLTLLFAFSQAVACGQAGVTLISPFVGRIYDWYKKAAGPKWDEDANAGVNDPGVKSVQLIYNHFKKHGIATEVMGASFRNLGQIVALAGCDLLTISPELLSQLQASEAHVPRVLDVASAQAMDLPQVHLNEAQFRLAMNEDAMASEKLAEGIRAFCVDVRKLEALMQSHLSPLG
jgi:transaldolase